MTTAPFNTAPFNNDLLKLQLEMMMMTAEAQQVITMRLLGMAGIWSVTPKENMRMVTEKVNATSQSLSRATQATMNGATPTEVASAAIAPMRRRTRANARRLSKRGFKTYP